MNIYLLSQNESRGYDTFDSMVVIAASEAGARRMSPNNSYEWSESHGMWLFNYNPEAWGANMPDRRERRDDWANDISKIKVQLLGTSNEAEASVVLASFNAG